MVEHNRSINPKSVKVEIFNVDEILKKEKGHDLLDIDPANLSLREKLRQKRQLENIGETTIFVEKPDLQIGTLNQNMKYHLPAFLNPDEIKVVRNINQGMNVYQLSKDNGYSISKGKKVIFRIRSKIDIYLSAKDIIRIEKRGDKKLSKAKLVNHPNHELFFERHYTSKKSKVDSKQLVTSEEFDSIFENISDVLDTFLTPREKEFVIRRIEGDKSSEIAEIYHVTTHTVEGVISEARLRLEAIYFKQKGIKRVANYKSQALRTAASTGQLRSKMFLGINYTMDNFVKENRKGKRKINEQLIAEGFILLKGAVTQKEYDKFRVHKKYQRWIIRKDGFIYTKPENIEIMRSLQK